jgi:purine nucleosidase
MKEKILLDTDIGFNVDDALAISYLLKHPNSDLIGITTVSSNTNVRASIASAVCSAWGRDDIPIYPGLNECMFVKQKSKYCPEEQILQKWPHRTKFPQNEAVHFLQQTIRNNPKEIILVGIGPMGNIGSLFQIDPEIPSLLKGLYLMCGKFAEFDFKAWTHKTGDNIIFNINRAGAIEFNACVDPFATAIVYQHTVTVHRSVGVDLTHQVRLSANDFFDKTRGSMHPIVRELAQMWTEFDPLKTNSVVFHDPLAVICIFNNSVCRFERGNVSVELQSEKLRGYTYFEVDSEGRHEIGCEVDVDAFFDAYFFVF